jgi:hypothetical protein
LPILIYICVSWFVIDFEKAKSAAEDMYWDLQGDNIFGYTIPEIRRINFIYYRKKCED